DVPTPELGDVVLVRVNRAGATPNACAFRRNDESIWCWGPFAPRRVNIFEPARPDAEIIDLTPLERPVPSDPRRTAGMPDEAHADLESSWDPACLIHRACPRPTTALPACPASLESFSWEFVRERADRYLGTTVHVRGSLRVSAAIGQTAVG